MAGKCVAKIAAVTFRPDFPYEDVDETVALANDRIYGLAANVWDPTATAGRTLMETVTVNGCNPMPDHHRLRAQRPWPWPRGRRARIRRVLRDQARPLAA